MREIIAGLRDRRSEIEAELSRPGLVKDRDRFREVSREHARLSDILALGERWLALDAQVAGNRELLATEDDPDLLELVREELPQLEEALTQASAEFELALLPPDPNDDRDAILEVRAGTGGDEAALFAEEVARMYVRFAERRGWKTELIGGTPGASGGMKEVSYAIRGDDVYGVLRWESGVHRVQRVPATESQGRIHTSAVTVAVLPEAEEVDVRIEENDLRIDVYRAQGPGGQSVNTTDSAVRITHLPSGIVVQCQDEKSQHKNKAKAMTVLRSRLLEQAIAEQEAQRSAERRSMVGTGDRSAKIRTYNFPQSRVTDHRIGLTVHSLDAIMQGELEAVVDAIREHRRQEALAESRGG
ncbi:peptide chain release factor 1 [bacterium]|nr:peptide chain release factor 1 [bacterium]MBU1073088.1 peptide chain release factor 1 [bacterium]MBU1675964.1 peptide chain release factor 1 [bacterium]